MKKLLILTGPQGSGNHLFSRLFSLHSDVAGWDELLDQYWVPSDQEPFAEYWVKPELLNADMFDHKDYHLANVSCPFFYNGTRYVPKILEVADCARSYGVDVSIAIVVRDKNINQLQQIRVRKEHTTPIALDYYGQLFDSTYPVHFVDHEAFFLYKTNYLRWLENTLKFPIAWDNPEILKFIDKDANHKYIKYVDNYWLDEYVTAGCQPNRQQRLKGS